MQIMAFFWRNVGPQWCSSFNLGSRVLDFVMISEPIWDIRAA